MINNVFEVRYRSNIAGNIISSKSQPKNTVLFMNGDILSKGTYNNRKRSVRSWSRNITVENINFKNFTSFTFCITNIQQQIDYAKYLDVLTAIYNQNICKLYQYLRNATKDNLTDSLSYRFKICSTWKACAASIWELQVALLLKFLGNFWR